MKPTKAQLALLHRIAKTDDGCLDVTDVVGVQRASAGICAKHRWIVWGFSHHSGLGGYHLTDAGRKVLEEVDHFG